MGLLDHLDLLVQAVLKELQALQVLLGLLGRVLQDPLAQVDQQGEAVPLAQ